MEKHYVKLSVLVIYTCHFLHFLCSSSAPPRLAAVAIRGAASYYSYYFCFFK